jgi:membrane fusion protein (multidrug efflux system)
MTEEMDKGKAPEGAPPPAKPKSSPARRLALLTIALLVLAGAVAAYWWFFLRNQVSTEDAYVDADVAQISARVPGTVARVLVDDDDPVTVGQKLVELDSTDYQVAVARAQAALAQAEADIQASRSSLAQTDSETSAQVQAAQATLRAAQEKEQEARHRLQGLQSQRLGVVADLALARRDFERADNLFRQGAGSEHRREEAQNALDKIQAQLESLDAQIKGAENAISGSSRDADRAGAQLQGVRSTRGNVEVLRHKVTGLEAARDKAKADLEAARLNLGYTAVVAPIAGYVAQKSVQLGERVQPGQALMAVVPLGEVYVDANFKETDLRDVRLGQPATVKADMYPDHTFHGKVAGIRAGTGAVFSLLPPENATGNWIKVVRRIPVRIRLAEPPPPDRPLRLGMSLAVTIDTTHRDGPVLLTGAPAAPPWSAGPHE